MSTSTLKGVVRRIDCPDAALGNSSTARSSSEPTNFRQRLISTPRTIRSPSSRATLSSSAPMALSTILCIALLRSSPLVFIPLHVANASPFPSIPQFENEIIAEINAAPQPLAPQSLSDRLCARAKLASESRAGQRPFGVKAAKAGKLFNGGKVDGGSRLLLTLSRGFANVVMSQTFLSSSPSSVAQARLTLDKTLFL